MKTPPLVSPGPALTVDEVRRYSRHLIIPDVAMAGQQRMMNAKVLCVGAGGLGSPALMYLAAAGIGTLGIVEFDTVDESNLQRQIIHGQSDIGKSKAESAREKIAEINPYVKVITHEVRLDNSNVMEIFAQYDIIVDGTDNFATRYLVNDACVLLKKPYVWGSIYRFDGQASVYWAEYGPCYRCLYPEPPPPGMVPSCAEGGVLGVLCPYPLASIGSQVGVGDGNRRQQYRRVRVSGILIEIFRRSLLDDFSQIHHRHILADVPDDSQVVTDHQIAQPARLLQILQQVHDLRPDRDV